MKWILIAASALVMIIQPQAALSTTRQPFERLMTCRGYVGSPAEFKRVIAQLYDRVPHVAGVDMEGDDLIDFLVAPDGSWTLTVTDADGRICVVANGRYFRQIDRVDGEPS